MKLMGLFLFVLLQQVSGTALSQGITLSGHRLPLRQVFDSVKAKTGYLFLYNPAVLKKTTPVTLNVKNASLKEVLDECLKGQSLSYKIVDRTILVAEKEAPRSEPSLPFRRITGLVRDTTNAEPLAGVSVQALIRKDGKWVADGGTFTDEKGHYSLQLADDNTLFVFSHTGFVPLTLPAKIITGNGLVQLRPGPGGLQEVMVNKGYYTATRELNTGDVTTINATVIGQQPVSDPLLALQGRVPGLIITRQSGLPGAALTVELRGQNSITSGNDPFYVVDGVPFTSSLLRTTNNVIISSSTTGGSPFSFLNPSDIESITVLKDADALAIYGSQGANGALLITTKKGKAGDFQVDVNVNQGMGKNTDRVSLLNTPQYLEMRNEALKNDGQVPGATDYDLVNFDAQRYTDWQKALTGGISGYTNAHVSVSGGRRNTTFLVSGTIFRQSGVFPGNFADRKEALHFSLGHQSASGRFKVSMTGNYLADDNKLPSADPTYDALVLPPNAPELYNPDGSLHWENGFANPLASLKQPYTNNTHNLILSAALNYQLLRGLQLKLNMGLTDLRSHQTLLTPIASQDPRFGPVTGNSSFLTGKVDSWIVEPGLSYSRHFGAGRLSAVAGMTFRQKLDQGHGTAGNGYTDDSRLDDLQAAAFVYTSLVTYAKYKYEAVYGQLNYSYKDRYVLNLTGRRDGSSRFGPGRQFAGFGAAGAAWLFGKERWVQEGLPFLSSGKLRGSYGTTGNDQIGDYGFLDLWSPNFYPYLGSTGFNPYRLYNPDFAWEINRKLEIGLELGFYHDRIRIAAGYYRNHSGNQLVGQPLTSTTGYTTITANLPAAVRNTGLECELSTVNIKEGDFGWSSSLNLTVPDNKLVSYPGLALSSYADVYIVGQSLNIEKLFPYRGADPATGLYVFADANGKLTSNPDWATDRTAVKRIGMRLYGGLTNTITWKGFSLDFLFQFVNQMANDLSYYPYLVFDVPGEQQNQPSGVLGRWQKAGDRTAVQQFSTNDAAGNAYYALQYSTRSVVTANYARLKNCSLSYGLPAVAVRKLHVRNGRLYLQGQDLFTITGYKGLDPETLGANLPPLRVVTAGAQLTF